MRKEEARAASGDHALRQSRDALVAWERSARLAELKWRDVPLWRLTRNILVDEYLARQGVRDRSNHNRPGLRALVQLTAGIVISLAHLRRLRRRRILVLAFPRRRPEGAEWVDPFSDPLIEFMGESTVLSVEKPFVGVHCRPPRTRRIVYYDWIMAVGSAAAWAFGWTARLFARSTLDALADRVSLRLDVPVGKVRRIASRELVRFRVESSILRAAMRLIRPEVVLLTSRWVHLPAIHAARSVGAKVLELQHGVPNPLGYKYSTVTDPCLDPDLMLTFGEYWSRFDWGLPRDRVIAIGYRHIWQRRAMLARGPGEHDPGLPVMLVSQPEMSARLSAHFEAIAEANADVRFLLKLHPQDIHGWRRRYPVGLRSNVEVCDEPAGDIQAMFSKCSAVVGHNSTALFEASFFGLKVGILNWDGTNDCPALDYVGRYNLFELRDAAGLKAMLEAPVAETVAGNPFLADFDASRFGALTGTGAGGH